MASIFQTVTFRLSIFSSSLFCFSCMYADKLWSDFWLLYGIIHIIIIGFFIGVTIQSVVFWAAQSDAYKFSFIPFISNIICLVLVITLPLNYIRNRIEFAIYKNEYNAAANIAVKRRKDLTTNLYNLPSRLSFLSVGGGDVILLDKPMKKAVFFYTFRGAPEGRSGFIQVRRGNSVSCINEMFGQVYKRKDLGKNWFYVAGE